MEFIGFFQALIIVTAIITLLYTCFRSLKFSCWPFYTSFSSSSDDDDDDDDIPGHREKCDDDDIPAPGTKYDVFISFRGEDTRTTFTSHLHRALLQKKIETYIDNRLVRGGEIAPALLEAIEKSTLSLVIFSQNYASSTWCLDELAHILDCREKYGQLVIPIFYGTDPSTVRKQKGSYEVAFAQLEKRFKGNIGKVNVWRDALTTAANLSGFSNKTGTEADLVTEVVNEIWSQLNRKSSSVLKGLVGMERRIEQIESSLCIDSLDVYSVGIWGMGGIGKTTLADAVFHRLSSKFEASCFLGNVKEKSAKEDGLVRLRNTLLSEILKENDLNIGTPTIGLDHVRKRMRGTKVLIVLDDVNDSNQINFLAGVPDQFGPGSRIIITTRDKSVLQKSVEQNKIYEVQELNSDEAFQLLHSSAFGNNISRVDCAELSKIVVDYCGGIPLALQSLGSSFLHCESKEDWLDEWKEFPREKIWEVLRSSYDGLKEIEKEIFLDIACFYQGKDVYIVKELLDILGFRASVINVLIDKSLISISTSNSLQMHNLLQEMGRAIVHKQCNEEPEKCSRLFVDEDFNRELKTNTGSPTLQAIFFNRSAIQGILWNHADSEKMYDLRLLYVYNSSRNKYCKVKVSLPDSLTYLDWEGYPFNSLPSKLSPENLVEIQMRNSQVEQLEGQNLINLRVMDLGLSKHLMEVPDLSQSPNIEHINLSGTAIKSVPASIGNLKSLEELDLSGTAITCLPASIKEASRLICLRLTNCRSLESLPELPGVRWLQAHGCTSLKKVLSSKTALTLGWDEYKNSQGLQEQLTFSNCIGMGWDAWCDILTDSQIRIVRMAIALSKHFKQEDIEVASHLEFEDESKEYVFRSPFCVVCSGNIIPRWFPYEVQKSVLQIKLGPNFFSTDFLGFAYSVVVAFKHYNVRGSLRLGCKINFKGRGDHCIYHRRSCMVAEYGEINECKFDEPHSFVWFSTLDHVKQGNYNGVTEAIFDFYPIVDDLPHGGAIDCSKIEVTMCGVYPMYARYMWFSYSMNRQF